MKLFRFAYRIIPQLRGLLKNIFKNMIIFDGRGAHLFIALESVGHYQWRSTQWNWGYSTSSVENNVPFKTMERFIAKKKVWGDCFFFFFFFLGGGGGVIFWQT